MSSFFICAYLPMPALLAPGRGNRRFGGFIVVPDSWRGPGRAAHGTCLITSIEGSSNQGSGRTPSDAPARRAGRLIVIEDADIFRPEHAGMTLHPLPHARLAALPMRSDLLLSIPPAFLDAPVTAPEGRG